MFSRQLKIFSFAVLLFVFGFSNFSSAASPERSFYVEPDYDLFGRNQMEAQLIRTTNKIYFYVDKDWYYRLTQKNELENKIYNLATDFEYKIYPTLIDLLGFEDIPGVDNDPRVIIILEPFKEGVGGYIRSLDQYPVKVAKNSNEGQIIYFNANLILKSPLELLDYQLAHEFTHLITLKQKPDSQSWFYELISEFAGQIIGVDLSPITKQRAQNLLYLNEVNLKDWKNSDKDYGKVYLFALYLKEQFGNQIFAEALKYPSSDGLVSFSEVLKRYQTNFDEVYLNWLIANIYNTCEVNNLKYCYQDAALKNYSVKAYSYYLPMQAKSLLSVTDSIKSLTGKWQKISGGLGTVEFRFTLPATAPISRVPYLIEDSQGKKTLGFLDFSSGISQKIYVNDLGSKNAAIYFIPFLSSQAEENRVYFYAFEANSLGNEAQTGQEFIEKLTKQIEELKKQIFQLQTLIALQKIQQSNLNCSFVFEKDLYYGLVSEEVKCLQLFLANLGPEIYPEKLITGYYGPLTMAAVQRYQALKGIMTTGYFGPLTRNSANKERAF